MTTPGATTSVAAIRARRASRRERAGVSTAGGARSQAPHGAASHPEPKGIAGRKRGTGHTKRQSVLVDAHPAGTHVPASVVDAVSLIQAWCRGRQIRLRMKQPPSVLAGLTTDCLSCTVRCAWSYNQGILQKAAASRLASVLAATQGAPSAIIVLQAASELLGGVGNMSRFRERPHDFIGAVLDERFDLDWVYARHLAGLAFDFTSAALICELILELSVGGPQHSTGGSSDTTLSWPALYLRPRTPPREQSRRPAGIDRNKVDDQIGRLENIEKLVQESAERLAEVKLRVQRTDASPTAEEHDDAGASTRHSISALQERRSAVDARIEKLVQRDAILSQRIEFGTHGTSADKGDADDGNDKAGGYLLPSAHLDRLRSVLLRAGSSPEGSPDGGTNDCRGATEWRRRLQPFTDEAGRLTWQTFREAIRSTLHGSDGLEDTSATTSDLALHVLFDTLDMRCSGTVLIDDLHQFLCANMEDYLRGLLSAVSTQLQEARSESAGLHAWIQAKQCQSEGMGYEDRRIGPTAGFMFEVCVGDQSPPSYKPFVTQDNRRLTPMQRQQQWRDQTWKHIRSTICQRHIFGRTHTSASDLFGSMVIESETVISDGSGAALIYYDDIVEVLRRLGLGFTDATIAKLMSGVDIDPNHGTVHLEPFLSIVNREKSVDEQ